MKTIKISEISTKRGYHEALDQNADWLLELLDNVMGDERWDKDSLKGQLDLKILSKNVDIIGKLAFVRHPACARCGQVLSIPAKINFQGHMTPAEDQRDLEDEQELTQDDLNFAFYEGDEIPIGQFINDEIALALPYNSYCEKPCEIPAPKGEHVSLEDHVDPRWAPLKNLKKKNDFD